MKTIKLNSKENLIPKNVKIIGNKILIQLHTTPLVDEEIKEQLIQPKFQKYETEGGKAGVRPDEFAFLYKGTVIQVPEGCKKYIQEHIIDEITEGTIVWINPQSLNSGSAQPFLHQRDKQIIKSEGYVRIHPSEIEAIETKD